MTRYGGLPGAGAATVRGVGIDVADARRFERLLARGAERVWEHWFTTAEAAQCVTATSPAREAALRFALKEAVFKTLDMPNGGPLLWRDIETYGRHPRWSVVLRGAAAARGSELGVEEFAASTCEWGGAVLATVIACGSHPRTSSGVYRAAGGPFVRAQGDAGGNESTYGVCDDAFSGHECSTD